MSALDQFAYWAIVRRGLLEALDMLSDEQLAFVPAEGLWSLGQVACHIAEAEDGWFRYAVTRELEEWPAGPTIDACPTLRAVETALDEVHRRTLAFLRLTEEEALDQPIDLPWEEVLTLREIIWHVLGHEIHHRGEIYLMLGMMGFAAPDV